MKRNLPGHLVWRLIAWLAYSRVSIIGREKIPPTGPVLFVATHRNGALDAAAYKVAVPEAIPMVSAQLHRLPFGRFLFNGIAVARDKDKARGIKANNDAAMQQCVDVLKNKGQLFIMPEGTSTLGPHHLPFRKGAARIAKAAIDAGIHLSIVPLGVHYEDATGWQSRVEIIVGDTVRVENAEMSFIHSIICEGLSRVGANFKDTDTQHTAEQLAYAATLGSDRSYARTLLSLARDMPENLLVTAKQIQTTAQKNQLCLHQDVPLMPLKSSLGYFLYALLLCPFISSFFLLNLPVVLFAHRYCRRLADEENVIAFWRMVIGLPLGLLWCILFSSVIALTMGANIMLGYWIFSVIGLRSWYRFRKLAVAVCNAWRHAEVRDPLLEAFENLNRQMAHVRAF